MRPVVIVTDSTHYTTRELIAAAGVHEVSLYVRDGGGSWRESELTDYDDFYARLRGATELPSTSQPSIGDFVAAYEPLLEPATTSSRSTSPAASRARWARRWRRSRCSTSAGAGAASR